MCPAKKPAEKRSIKRKKTAGEVPGGFGLYRFIVLDYLTRAAVSAASQAPYPSARPVGQVSFIPRLRLFQSQTHPADAGLRLDAVETSHFNHGAAAPPCLAAGEELMIAKNIRRKIPRMF
jgi:hypothetical protein